MPKEKAYKCAVCPARRDVSNHWLCGFVVKSKKHGRVKGYSVILWDERSANRRDCYHLCGQNCALRFAEMILTEARAPMPMPEQGGPESFPLEEVFSVSNDTKHRER